MTTPDTTEIRKTAAAWLSVSADRRDAQRAGAVLVYDEADPFAVRLLIDGMEFVFARSLLLTGVNDEGMPDDVADYGSVLVFRDLEEVRLELATEDGGRAVWLRAGRVRQFLGPTFKRVRLGSESMDWDAAVADLLGRS